MTVSASLRNAVSDYIKTHSNRDDRMWVFGYALKHYILAERMSPTKFYVGMDWLYVKRWQDKVSGTILADSRNIRQSSSLWQEQHANVPATNREIAEFIEGHYSKLPVADPETEAVLWLRNQ